MATERRGRLLVFGAALIWSTGGVGIKAVAAAPLAIACYRSAFAALALCGLFGRPRWRSTPAFLATVVSGAGCLTTFVVATRWTTAANAIFLQYSGVAWVLLLSPLVLGEPLRGRDVLASAVAFAGMGLFFLGELEARGRAGNLVALFSGALYAAFVLTLRSERERGAEAAVTYVNMVVALTLLPVVARGPVPAAPSLLILVFLGVVQIGLAQALFVRGLRHVPAAQAALVGMVEPVANPVWVFLLLGETPRPLALLGGAIVLAAIAWRTVGAGHEATVTAMVLNKPVHGQRVASRGGRSSES